MSKAQERRDKQEEEKRQAHYRTQFYGNRDPLAMMERQRSGSGARFGRSQSGSRERRNAPVYDKIQNYKVTKGPTSQEKAYV